MTDGMVSIIIPVFNRYELVKIMIDSIVVQTYKNWELLLVDDGSTDGTVLKIEDYIKDKEKIFLIKRDREEKGAPVCRNIGLKKAMGEYIVFFDSDDVVSDICLEQRVAYLKAHNNLDAAVFPARHFQKSINEKDGLLNGIPIFKDDLAEFLNSNLPYIVWNVIFRKKSLIEAQVFWDEKLLSLQDADFNIQCIIKGLHIGYAVNPQVDYFARAENNNSISAAIFKQSRFDSHLYFVEKQFQSLSSLGKRKYHKDLYSRLVYTYLLMAVNYSEDHVKKLVDLARKYNCNRKKFTALVKFHHFLVKNVGLNVNIANDIAFPLFVLTKRRSSYRRKQFNTMYFK